jgi:two-component system sensor histidine kinase VicK
MEIELRNKGQELKFFIEDSIPFIKADRDRMEQVILNLLSNAIKYTPENGKISIYLSSTSNQVYVRVVDTGIGIPKEDLPRIFERFYRVDKARSREMGGTGLGLSIAKEITEIHGGTITVKSEVGKGTEFLLRLPAAETKEKGGESISLTGSL